MNRSQTVLGVAIIIIAVIVLLANINIGFARELVASWWPLLLVSLGLYMLWSDRNNLVWGMIVTGVGIGLLINTLGVFGLSFGDVFVPIVLLALGAAVLMGAFGRDEVRDRQSSRPEETVSAVLGGATTRNSAGDYRGGAVNAVLGGVDLDLSKATIKKEAVLQVWVLMGGVTLRVPEGVIIKQRTVNILGGIDDKTASTKDAGAPVLYIDGMVTMGGVDIKH